MSDGRPSEGGGEVDAIAGSLREVFGDRAIDVALRQHALAEGHNADTWRTIVERLGG